MKSNYKPLGNYIKQIKKKNTDGSVSVLKGIRINKEFMESVANIQGTDLSRYRVVEKHQFAYNPMHVGRDEILPISLLLEDEPIIVSPAYVIFEILDHNVLNPEYLMMWCRRSEFDRNVWFTTDSSVRGGFSWESLCELELPIPSIEKQNEIVKEYNTIVNRIKLNETLNQKLEDTAQALYKHWFVDFNFPIDLCHSEQSEESFNNIDYSKGYKSSGGEMVYNAELDMEIPEGWEVKSFTSVLNLKGGGTPSTTNAKYWDGEIPFFTPKDVNNSYYSSITEKYITTLGLENCSSKLYPKNTIFITARGTVGSVSVAACKMAMNQSCYAIVEDETVDYCYAHQLTLETLKSLINQASGAIFKALVTKDFNEFFLAKPSQTVLNQFKSTVEPIYNLLLNKSNQIEELIKLKDLLLSKMSRLETKTVEI